jgi:hypothetical protein
MATKCSTSTKGQTEANSIIGVSVCVMVDCEYTKDVKRVTTLVNGVKTVKYFDSDGVEIIGAKEVPCASLVEIVKTKCDKTVFDREPVMLCHPNGTKVYVQDVTPEDAPLGTAPTFSFWTIAIPSVPYTGDTSQLKDCGTEKIDLTAAEWFCASGVPISRSDAWDISVSPRALIGSIWQDAAGTVIPAPVAGSYVIGDCNPVKDVDKIDWCIDGQDFTQWVQLSDLVPTGVSTWTNLQGVVVSDPTVGATVLAKGMCKVEYTEVSVCLI